MTDIYLDHNASSPLDADVLDAMLPFYREHFGNAASVTHAHGKTARAAVERAREQLAALLGCASDEIVWTSGATESCNLALSAAMRAYADKGRHLVTQATEHPAVLDTCDALRREGCAVTVLGVDSHGCVQPSELAAALRSDTVLVSIMTANNETGSLQPLAEISQLCRSRGVLLHTDAAQAVGRIQVQATTAAVDLLSCNAHKMHGPKGAGALFVRGGRALLRGRALIHGGGHEHGLRSGTLDVPAIVGFGAAAERAGDVVAEAARQAGLRDALQHELCTGLSDAVVHGHPVHRLPNTLNISLGSRDAQALIDQLPHIAMSSGAACTSARRGPSHVLEAMGCAAAEVFAAVRLSVGRTTTTQDIARAAQDIIAAARRLNA